jgi:hypothetical protein
MANEQPSAESLKEALALVCKRTQWSEETPSAYDLSWARDIALLLDRTNREAQDKFAAECQRFHDEGRKCVTCGREDLDEIRRAARRDMETAIIRLWYVAKHLNISEPPKSTDLLTAVALVERAAEWARLHIERRGKENDELRAALQAAQEK